MTLSTSWGRGEIQHINELGLKGHLAVRGVHLYDHRANEHYHPVPSITLINNDSEDQPTLPPKTPNCFSYLLGENRETRFKPKKNRKKNPEISTISKRWMSVLTSWSKIIRNQSLSWRNNKFELKKRWYWSVFVPSIKWHPPKRSAVCLHYSQVPSCTLPQLISPVKAALSRCHFCLFVVHCGTKLPVVSDICQVKRSQ